MKTPAPLPHVIPVLLYHSISDRPPVDQVRFTVSPARFEEHMRAIVGSGRVPLTISELAAALRGERQLPALAVAVTFDDGFADTPHAVQTLAEQGITSTVFVATGRLGGQRPALPAGALRALLAIKGVELGAHTVSHPHLDELDIGEAWREIFDSKRVLEDHAGAPVRSFAYPHGSYNELTRRAVVATGFTAAAAVKNAYSHPGDDPFAIARWTVTTGTTARQVERFLEGRGAPLAWTKERHRTRAYRGARQLRRRLRDFCSTPGFDGAA